MGGQRAAMTAEPVLVITTERPDATYAIGEEVRWQVGRSAMTIVRRVISGACSYRVRVPSTTSPAVRIGMAR